MTGRSLSRPERFAIRFIHTYQLEVRHRLHARCGSGETCSAYALRMFEEHGFLRASRRTISRIARCRPPHTDRRIRRSGIGSRFAASVGVIAMLGLMGTLFIAPARATVTSGCYGTANGRPFASITRASPLRVALNSRMNLRGGSQLPVSNYAVQLYYFGVQYGVRTGRTTQNRWQGTFTTSQFLTRGTGNYIVRGLLYPDLSTTTCVATLYFDVEGDPLSSTSGQVGAGLTGAGILGLIASAVTGGKVPPGFESTASPEDEAEIERQKKEDEARKKQQKEDEENAKLAQQASAKLCFFLAFPALLMTAGAMAAGAGASGGAVTIRHYPRVHWRPKLSVVGIGSGVLFGAGSGILLQQYGVIWPTLGIGISILVGGLLLGILIPSLGRLRAVRKLNRRLDVFEHRAGVDTAAAAAQEGAAIPADWYPDPSGEARLRYWDGTAWTDHTSD